MDCLEAQMAISDALDSMPVDPEVLDVAKDHCRVCPDCAAFVRGLSIVKRAPLPAPSGDLADRVMAEVRAEAQTASHAAAATATFGATGPALPTPPGAVTSAVSPAEKPAAGPRPGGQIQWKSSPAAWAWMAAASVFVLGVMILTVNGVKSMSGGGAGSQMQVTDMKTTGVTAEQAAPAAASSGTAGGSGVATAAAGAPSYITVGGNVYKLEGNDTTVTASRLSAVGQTTSALDGTTPVPRTVLRGTDSSLVYIQADPQTLVRFQRVTRTYGGNTYGLVSQDLTQYGMWPTLPTGIPAPSSPDGAPTFSVLGTDANGTTVYQLTSGGSGSGIAVAPGAPGDDPSAGNPGWTWWTLLP